MLFWQKWNKKSCKIRGGSPSGLKGVPERFIAVGKKFWGLRWFCFCRQAREVTRYKIKELKNNNRLALTREKIVGKGPELPGGGWVFDGSWGTLEKKKT